MATENFLRLMGRLLQLTRVGFRGKVTINFDGKGPKDIVEQKHQALADLELGDEEMAQLWELAKRLEQG